MTARIRRARECGKGGVTGGMDGNESAGLSDAELAGLLAELAEATAEIQPLRRLLGLVAWCPEPPERGSPIA